MSNFKKVFSIHFPEKQVYIESTFKTLNHKMEEIKKNKDHHLYRFLKKYPNPVIEEEGYGDENNVYKSYIKNGYIILSKLFLIDNKVYG